MSPKNILVLTSIFILVGCGGGSGTSTPTVASFELLDPNAAANNGFGYITRTLANGNIVVANPLDDTVATNAGAVHLYNPFTKAVIASFYGDNANDQLGESSVTALGNNNFVIASRRDDVNSVTDAGSVMLVSGTTGVQIGTTIAGDTASDFLGINGVTALGSNNFVIASAYDDVNSVVNAGSVMLVNGTTGAQIGTTLAGDTASDNLGGTRITALGNNNFVIASAYDDVNSVVNAGSVMLINGATGAQINTIEGDTAHDALGLSGVTALGNNNFVIASRNDDVNSVTLAGSVMLINGVTGAQIGTTLAGDTASDQLGENGVTALGNNNFVIASAYDDVNSVTDAGSVMLINGATGAQINTIEGDTANDWLGNSSVTALGNNNFVIASLWDDVNSVVNAGSVMLINGATGAQIGTTIAGDTLYDELGGASITALGNNNFVIASIYHDVNSVVNAGSVMLVNGATGAQIGSTIAGDTRDDYLGNSSITALGNNNFVIASAYDDVNSVSNAGSVMLVSGATGAQIGTTIAGYTANDNLGNSGVTALGNNNFVIASRNDDVNSVVNAGSIRQIDTTGTQVSIIAGAATNDMSAISVTDASTHNFYVVSLRSFDNNSMTDSGFATVVAY
ncbi:MAG: beta strand repeat-containing protein [Pseudomonadales bacterium]|jgi:RNase P/RNase MRP subunit p29